MKMVPGNELVSYVESLFTFCYGGICGDDLIKGGH